MTAGTALLAVGLLIATVIAWRRRSWAWAAGLGAAALLFVVAALRWLADHLSWPGLLLVLAVPGLIVWQRWSRTAGSLGRWNRRSRRKSGVASGVDVLRVRGRVRGLATVVRPSLSVLSRWQRLWMPTAAVGVRICRVGPLWVWSSQEGVVVILGGPRFGKTAAMSDQILDAPGAAVVTSTKTELYRQLGELRRRTGPVVVFNPAGLGGVASTIAFDPLCGCTDPVTAAERAEDMIPPNSGGGSGDREHWNDAARAVLTGLLHAAALGGLTMYDVSRWISAPEQGKREVPALLRRSGGPAFEQEVVQFFGTNDRTQTSITNSIRPALGWLTHPPAAAAGRAGATFDVAWMLRARATVFLLGRRDARTKALMCALTGHIAREARRIAEDPDLSPGRRLDPPLRIALDEAVNICPVPLPQWTSDMGGLGITILAIAQSRAQLIDCYGREPAAALLTNAATTVIHGGCSDREDLTHFSTLLGERDEWVTSSNTGAGAHGRGTQRSLRRVPVMQPAQIAALAPFRVIVLTSGCPPVLGWSRKGWRRWDVRTLAAHHARCERLHQRTRRLPVWRVAGGGWIERALAAGAGRWPDRIGDRARRRHEYNALRKRLDLMPVRRARLPNWQRGTRTRAKWTP